MKNEKTRASELEERFKPNYAELLLNVEGINYDKCVFCPQWGDNFPFEEEHSGMMVIGRACNGWLSTSQDINVLFGTSEEAIFNRSDQMKWVEDSAGSKDKYNTNRSAFWRVVKQIAQSFYPKEWQSHIAWSNVCKVAPWEGGNPNNALYHAQLESCQKIFEAEMKAFSPKVVIMFTGYDWAKDFLEYLNKGQEPTSIERLKWDKYECLVYLIEGTYFIVTKHPQGKKEKPHAECIVKYIKDLSHEA